MWNVRIHCCQNHFAAGISALPEYRVKFYFSDKHMLKYQSHSLGEGNSLASPKLDSWRTFARINRPLGCIHTAQSYKIRLRREILVKCQNFYYGIFRHTTEAFTATFARLKKVVIKNLGRGIIVGVKTFKLPKLFKQKLVKASVCTQPNRKKESWHGMATTVAILVCLINYPN